MNNQSIDINQRIPLEALHIALQGHLKGDYSEGYILEQLKVEFQGENRLRKSLRIVNKIILRNPLNEFIATHRAEVLQSLKRKQDRNIILISLLNSTFSFSFYTLQLFGKYLSVQELVNTETIKKALSSKFGGNRATENALYSVVPMFLEAGFISRPTPGLYHKTSTIILASPIARRIYEKSFDAQHSNPVLPDMKIQDPYFLFLR
jgi:hypothetical protein